MVVKPKAESPKVTITPKDLIKIEVNEFERVHKDMWSESDEYKSLRKVTTKHID